MTEEDKALLDIFKTAAVQYCREQTGLNEKEVDEKEDITIVVLAVISHMWDNRSVTTNEARLNPVIDTILSMHATNLLPSPDCEVV